MHAYAQEIQCFHLEEVQALGKSETEGDKGCPALDRLLLSSITLLCIGVEQACMPALQALEYLDELLASLVNILAVRGLKLLNQMSSEAAIMTSMLSSTRALCASLPTSHASDSIKLSISKSTLSVLKMLVQSQESGSKGSAASNNLELASLGWFACQNVLAASSQGGLVNVHCEDFAAMEMASAMEEFIVMDCCDMAAESGVFTSGVFHCEILLSLHEETRLCVTVADNQDVALKGLQTRSGQYHYPMQHHQLCVCAAGTEAASGVLEIAANCTWCMATWACQGSQTEIRRLCSCVICIHDVSEVWHMVGLQRCSGSCIRVLDAYYTFS